MTTIKKVNWKSYAQKYDMLLRYNPFYQQVHQEVMQEVKSWTIGNNDLIADVGAGTGNYSLALARQFPQAKVLHIDNDPGMNAVTMEKRETAGILNHQILDKPVGEVQLNRGSLRALVSVHALYTFPQPYRALRKMYQWLEPGGHAILVDAGRVVNVAEWKMAIGWQLFRHWGLRKTLQIMRSGKEVSKQNAYIRDMQRRGEFWTHSHQEFCSAVQEAGFDILKSRITFRGVSDLVVAHKPRS